MVLLGNLLPGQLGMESFQVFFTPTGDLKGCQIRKTPYIVANFWL